MPREAPEWGMGKDNSYLHPRNGTIAHANNTQIIAPIVHALHMNTNVWMRFSLGVNSELMTDAWKESQLLNESWCTYTQETTTGIYLRQRTNIESNQKPNEEK